MKIFQHHWLGKKATTAQQDCHRNSYHSPSSPVRSVSHTLFSLLFSLSLSFSSPLHLSAFITVSYTPSIFLSRPFPLPPLLHLHQHSLIWSFLPFTTHFSLLSFQLFILVNTIFFQLHSLPLLLIAFPCISSVSHFN